MKHMTVSDVNTLKELIRAKKDKIDSYTRIANRYRESYPLMTKAQLAKAYKEVQELKQAIAEERVWIKQAEAKIRKFYAPAA